MTVAATALGAATAASAAAVAAALVLPRRRAGLVAAGLSAAAAAAGAVGGFAVLAGGTGLRATVPWLIPFGGAHLALDPLGAVFVLLAALVAAPVALYGLAQPSHAAESRIVTAVLPLFAWSVLIVPTAASATTFLALWETMAVSSLVLVAAEHNRNPAVRSATVWYAAMTQLGFAAILLAFAFLAGRSGGDAFGAIRAAAPGMPAGTRSAVFVLALVGFGSKSGAVPLHVWLPKAHPEAPSHVSALMSGAMVKLGVYGLLRVGWDLLGGGPRWWWALVLAVGGVSALFGVLHALVATDLKRLLAYSTSENVGLVLVGIGAAGLFAASGSEALSGAALVAALLHCLNHAAFKALLFLAAGNVVHSTGTRDLDRLGGLVRRMPFTAAGFAVGALAIAGLPPFNGFVSEWLLLQALVHGLGSSSDAVRVVMPVAVAVVALTGGLAVATFVKAFGTGFLALPRSAEAAAAREGARPTQAAIALLAGACAVTGLFPALALGPLNRAVGDLGAAGGAEALRNGVLEIRSVGIPSTMAPAIVALVLVLAAVPVLWTRRRTAGRAVVGAPVWGCGRTVHTPRMEYTATAFAEPLLRVFDDVLHPDRDVDVSHSAESRYYVEAVRFRQGVRDAVDERAYAPLLRTARRWGLAARHIQNGSIHRYLAYMFVAVVVVLVVAR